MSVIRNEAAEFDRLGRGDMNLMRDTIRRFLLLEGASFVIAGLIHFGVLIAGYRHRGAAIPESTIGVVLLLGFALTWLWPAHTRLLGIVAQGFALLGTAVGIVMVTIGVGPRTLPDVIFHLAIFATLVWGLVVAVRAPAGPESRELVHGTGAVEER